MDPQFAFEVHRRREIEQTRRLEFERIARERIDATGPTLRRNRGALIHALREAFRAARASTQAPSACCASSVACA